MIEYFDMTCPTELVVDASPCALGTILTQKKSDESLSVVEYASRKLSDTESRYSQTEREVLGVVSLLAWSRVQGHNRSQTV